MSDDRGCTVTFEGDHGGTYYTSCDTVQYLDDDLTNNSNTTIYLYKDKNYSQTRGEYIQIGSHQYPRWYQSGSGYNAVYITNAHDTTFNGWSNMYRDRPVMSVGFEMILMIFAICAILIKK